MLDAKLADILTRLEHQLAPAALELAALVIRVNAAWNIVIGIVVLILSIVLVKHLKSLWWKLGLSDEGNIVEKVIVLDQYSEDSTTRQLKTGIGILVIIIGGVIQLVTIFNPWSWIAVVNPKLELAHQVLSKILK